MAALLVALRHMVPAFFPIRFPVSYLAVDVFFVLSGVVIANAYETKLAKGTISITDFIFLRLLRIYPLYLLGLALGIAASYYMVDTYGQYTAFNMLSGLFLIPALSAHDMFPFNEPGWSLSFEIIMVFVYGIVLCRTGNRVAWTVCLVSLFFIFIEVFTGENGMDFGYRETDLADGVARVGFSFSIGVIIYRWFQSAGRPVLYGNKTGLLLLIVTILTLMAPLPQGPNRGYFGLFAVICIFPIIVHFAIRTRLTGLFAPISTHLGVISYPLYAIHAPLYLLVSAMLLHHAQFNVGDAAPWAGFVMLTAFCLLSSALHHRIDLRFGGPFVAGH